MNGQQSPVAPESSRSEAVAESLSEPEPNTVEDGNRLWRNIQAQTGFNSYGEYVQAYKEREDRSDLEVLKRWIGLATKSHAYNICSIIDVLAHEDSLPQLSIRYHSEPGYELLAALRQPPKHVCIQVLIWSIPILEISSMVLDMVGLGLRIDPQFVLALIKTLRCNQQAGDSVEIDSFHEAIDNRPLRRNHVVIDHAVATFVGQYPFDMPAAAPIILIAGDISLQDKSDLVLLSQLRDGISDVDFRRAVEQKWDFINVASQSVNESPPFTNPSPRGNSPSVHLTLPWVAEGKWGALYKESFNAFAGYNPKFTSCTAAIIAGVLMPMLEMNCFKIKAQSIRLRQRFLALQGRMDKENPNHQLVNYASSELHRARFLLRRSVESSDDDMSHFERYISAEDANYLPESSAYLKIKQESDWIHNEARRLDIEVRDYLQLVVGNLSLEESRKSIEVSNQQILEGKRGLWPYDEDRQTFADQV